MHNTKSLKPVLRSKISRKRQSAARGFKDKVVLSFTVLAVVFAVFTLIYALTPLFPTTSFDQPTASKSSMAKSSSKLTTFDRELALKFMDKDRDGKCDSCGMPVEMCIDSGELQCTMSGKSAIGKLNSQHIHADFKVYVNGRQLDFSDKAHMERMRANLPVSSFIHVDSGAPAPEKTGDVLHMHATGVPLWIFFESIGMKFDKQCLVLEEETPYCEKKENTLKLYVNGRPNERYEQYVFQDDDKILISYGNKNEDAADQLGSITDFANDH